LPLTSITFLEKPHTELSAEDFAGRHIDAVIGEPYFTSSLLPWHNLHFWYVVNSLQKLLHPKGNVVLPGRGSLMAIAGEWIMKYLGWVFLGRRMCVCVCVGGC